MQEARSFFEDEVLSTMPSQPGPEGNKTPLWEQAKMVKVSLGDALVVPIKYEKPQGIKVEGAKTVLDLQKSSCLLIYKDKNQKMQAEWVSFIPKGPKINNEFVGIISINEWNGKSKRAFAFNENGDIGLMQETKSYFRKASMRNSFICYTMDYYTVAYSPNHPEWGYEWNYDYSRTYCISFFIYGNTTSFDFTDDSENNLGSVSNGNSSGMPPYDYSSLTDCAGIVGGTAIFSEKCQTCIGGTTGIERCNSDELESIMKEKNACLTSGQMEILNKSFNKYFRTESKYVTKYQKCMRNLLYNKIYASDKKIGFCVNDTVKGNAVYRPISKDIIFKTESTLGDDRILGHELFHVYQDTHYPGGISQYQIGKEPLGYPNIEFEQALFNDIINKTANAMGSGASQIIIEDYKEWLLKITNNYRTTPKEYSDFQGEYKDFLMIFYLGSEYQYQGLIKSDLLPTALLTFFSTSNCN